MCNENIRTNPGLVAVLSFIFSGLGQIYNGQIFKGILIMMISAIGIMFLVSGSILIAFLLLGKILGLKILVTGVVLFLLGLTICAMAGIYSILDAYRTAARK
ncbi:MAG: hypothetical protein PHO70_05050 [Candidatus Omnitrophica bacterium]|nr:hypothetical protein [Candidatus Omnitrophota bacterium]